MNSKKSREDPSCKELEAVVKEFLSFFLSKSFEKVMKDIVNLNAPYPIKWWSIPNTEPVLHSLIKQKIWGYQSTNTLISLAKDYRLVWEAVIEWLSYMAVRQAPISKELQEFLAFAAMHPEKKPNHKRQDPLLNLFRDQIIIASIVMLKNGKYPLLTRNDSHDEKNDRSACDIVSDIITQDMLTENELSYRRIKEIWEQAPKNQKQYLESIVFHDHFHSKEYRKDLIYDLIESFVLGFLERKNSILKKRKS